jgi:hypothetical protein
LVLVQFASAILPSTIDKQGFPCEAPFDARGHKTRKPDEAYTMMKLRIATGLGLLFMATMIGSPVRVSPAQANEGGGVTLASLAGNFASRGGGFSTV